MYKSMEYNLAHGGFAVKIYPGFIQRMQEHREMFQTYRLPNYHVEFTHFKLFTAQCLSITWFGSPLGQQRTLNACYLLSKKSRGGRSSDVPFKKYSLCQSIEERGRK